MSEVSVAERILARLTSREHAAAIVGDLMQESPKRGGWSLFFAVSWIVLHKYWRLLAAVPIALLFSHGRRSPEQLVINLHPVFSLPHSVWTILFVSGLDLGWVLFPYFAVRCGWRDTATQISGVVFILFNAVWLSGVSVSSSAFGIFALMGLIFAGVASHRYRDAAVLLVAIVLVYALNFGLIISVQQGEVGYAVRHHVRLVFWPAMIAMYVAYVNLLLTATFAHRWLRERRNRLLILEG